LVLPIEDIEGDLTVDGDVEMTGDLIIGAVTVEESEAAFLEGATAGTKQAGKAVVADANKNTGKAKVTELNIGASGSEILLTSSKLIDISNNQVSTSTQVDAAVAASSGPIRFITDDALTGTFGFAFAINDIINVPLFDTGPGGEGKVCVADFMRFIRATTAEQAVGSFSYALVRVGSAPPGTFSLDPLNGVAADTFTCSDLGNVVFEIWIEGPSTNQMFAEATVTVTDVYGVCPP